MANKFLLPVYKKVFDQPFSYGNFDDRLKMQKLVYLLQEEGVNIGHYGFDWYKHGPYSQVLLDDMYIVDGTTSITLNYSPDTENRIVELKNIFHDEEAKVNYGMKNWTECLASIHFLKKKIMGSNASEDDIIRELKNRKPHLNNNNLNKKAYRLIENLYE
jgi:uncharacterized protein YwgA